MTMLNKAAGELIAALPAGVVHACTDITGFGLMGHASEMAAASGCSLEIEAAAVPLLDGARDLVTGNVPGGGRTNRQHFGARIEIAASVDAAVADLLFDPQTSGGLLMAIAGGRCRQHSRGAAVDRCAGCAGRRRAARAAGR